MDAENWKPVRSFEGLYEVSHLGRVRSLFTRVGGAFKLRSEPLILKQVDYAQGRLYVHLRNHPARGQTISVHRLVLEAFVGPRPSGMEACHWDGDCKNNRLSNLRWDTHQSNMEDDCRNGVVRRLPRGEAHSRAKLVEEDVRAIRAEPHFSGVNPMLAKCFGVSRGQISSIRNSVTWKWFAEDRV